MGTVEEIRGWNAWLPRAWPLDITSITRWLDVSVLVSDETQETLLLRFIVGWDDSALPVWVTNSATGRLKIAVQERPPSQFLDLLAGTTRASVASSTIEVRRVEPPIDDWYGGVDSRTFNLHIPLALYEIWTTTDHHACAMTVWASLGEAEKAHAGIAPAALGYLGSTVVLVPQRRAFLSGTGDLVLVGERDAASDLRVYAEVFDGPTVLSQAASLLRLEPARELPTQERPQYLRVHFSTGSFASMNESPSGRVCTSIARYPATHHGVSGSDWKVTVVGSSDGCSASVGLIRGIGGGYFTKEPWRSRAPHVGFSAPARVSRVSNLIGARTEAIDTLRRVGAPASLCDPYAVPDDLSDVLTGGRIITSKKAVARIDAGWARRHRVSVSVVNTVHDRFLVGPKCAFLIGSSLNTIGAKHSFLVELDNTMRLNVSSMFEELWLQAAPAM